MDCGTKIRIRPSNIKEKILKKSTEITKGNVLTILVYAITLPDKW